MTHTENYPLSLRRLRAVAILKFGSVDALHKKLPVCGRAVWAQIQRGRLSTPLHDAMRTALGTEALRFVYGEVDELRDEGSGHAV